MKRNGSSIIAAIICCAIMGASGLYSLLVGRIAMRGYKIEGLSARVVGALLAIGASWAIASTLRKKKNSTT